MQYVRHASLAFYPVVEELQIITLPVVSNITFIVSSYE